MPRDRIVVKVHPLPRPVTPAIREKLLERFQPYGAIDIKIHTQKAIADIIFTRRTTADHAIAEQNGKKFCGKKVRVRHKNLERLKENARRAEINKAKREFGRKRWEEREKARAKRVGKKKKMLKKDEIIGNSMKIAEETGKEEEEDKGKNLSVRWGGEIIGKSPSKIELSSGNVKINDKAAKMKAYEDRRRLVSQLSKIGKKGRRYTQKKRNQLKVKRDTKQCIECFSEYLGFIRMVIRFCSIPLLNYRLLTLNIGNLEFLILISVNKRQIALRCQQTCWCL